MARPLPLLLSALIAALLMPAPAAGATATAACSATGLIPAAGNLGQAQRSTLCLLNAHRRRHGLAPLRREARLARAAKRHTADMVRHRYFAHDSRNGASFSYRIRATGYLSQVRSWTVGENLAWGSGSRGTPASIVASWMGSPGHRANILNGRFREIGIGLTLGTLRGGHGATYATEFGAVIRR